MKQYKKASAVLIIVPMFFLVMLSACAGPELVDQKAPETFAEEVAAVDAIDTAEMADSPAGLDIVMDGSSLEAFERSLEKVRQSGSEVEYGSLKRAIEYLLIYDLGAKHSREKLAARLDGITGQEILARVNWGKKNQ